jgi:hypothetical protein
MGDKVVNYVHDVMISAYSIFLVWVAYVSQAYESSHMLRLLLQNLMVSENIKSVYIIKLMHDCQ